MFFIGPFLHLTHTEGNEKKVLWPQYFRDMPEVPASAFSSRVYELPVAAVTKTTNVAAESNTHLFSYSPGGRKSEMGQQG